MGTMTDLAAPGEGMVAPTGDSGYSSVEGTSFATPLVTGAVVLLQQIYQARFGTLPTVNQVTQWLEQGSDPIYDPVTGLTIGRLDIPKAAGLIPAATSSPAPPAAPAPATISIPALQTTPGITEHGDRDSGLLCSGQQHDVNQHGDDDSQHGDDDSQHGDDANQHAAGARRRRQPARRPARRRRQPARRRRQPARRRQARRRRSQHGDDNTQHATGCPASSPRRPRLRRTLASRPTCRFSSTASRSTRSMPHSRTCCHRCPRTITLRCSRP